MLRRTLASQWFDGLINELTGPESREVILAFPEGQKNTLDRLEEMDKQQEAEAEREWSLGMPAKLTKEY